jgi:hypothetical protein
MIKTALLSMLILSTAAGAYADTAKRAQWWKLRAESSQKERDELSKKGASPLLLDLLEKETVRSNELAVKAAPEGGSTPSPVTIREAAAKIVPDAFAAWSLRYLVSGRKNMADPIRVLAAELRRVYAEKGIEADARYAEEAVKKALNAEERDYCRLEYQLLSLNSCMEKIIPGATEAIIASAAEQAAASPSTTDPYAAAAAAADRYFRSFDFAGSLNTGSTAAAASWCRMKAEHALRRDAERLSAASEFTALTAAGFDAARIDALCSRQSDFEKIACAKLSTRLMDTAPFDIETTQTAERPKEPDTASLFAEMDKIRNAALHDQSSVDVAIQKADSEMLAAIAKYMKPSTDAFFRQEEKMKILAGEDPAEVKEKASPLSRAKEQLKEKIRKANLYRTASLHLISFIRTRSGTSAQAFALYEKRLDAARQYLSMLCALDGKAAGCSSYPSDSAKIYEGLHARERALFDYVQSVSAVTAAERRLMDKGEIEAALKLKSLFTKDYAAALTLISGNRAKTSLGSISVARSEIGRSDRDDAAFAKIETAALAESLELWSNAASTLEKTFTAFESYALLYTRLESQAREGALTDELQRAVKEESLLPQIRQFSAADIAREASERAFIRKTIQRNIAQLKTLADYYARRKISCADIPAPATLKEMEKKAGQSPAAAIGDWTMTEGNFAEVDRKAAKVLSNLRKRSAWSTGEKSSVRAADVKKGIDQAGISISIPEGFEEQPVGGRGDETLLRRYASIDNLSTISVSLVPLDGKTEREAAEEWTAKQGKTIVRSSTGKISTGSFYWNISKDLHRNVAESWAVARGEKLVIITGETSKDRYPFFKERISAVFKSAE